MKVIDRIPSREPCAEAGWYAWDYRLDAPLEDGFILALRGLGDFVYLRMLKRPFFKIESADFLIRGLKGDDFVRVALHGGEDVRRVEIETALERAAQAQAAAGERCP